MTDLIERLCSGEEVPTTEIITALREQDWRKGAHIEGVLDELKTAHSLLEQCQRDHGKKDKRIEELETKVQLQSNYIKRLQIESIEGKTDE